MEYTGAQFQALKDLIVGQGGALLTKMCSMRTYEFAGKVQDPPNTLPGCGNATIFEIPYRTSNGSVRPIELCAVCDDLGRRPRYLKAMRA